MKNKLIPELGIVLLISTLYLFTRVQSLTILPVFGDEAIYLRWSQIIKSVDTLRFVPVTDGKQPLFMWITVAFFKIFSDPLFSGRLLSVFSGLLNLLSLYFIGRFFISRKVAIISSIVYLILPFTFFFDRLSLPDSLLSALGSLSLLFSILLAKYPRLDLAMILGIILGLSWLTKSPAIYFITLSAFTFILYNPKNIKKIYLPAVSVVFSFVIYNILRLGPQFSQINIRNRDYVWGISDIISHPLDPFIPHLRDLFVLYSQYISIPLLIVSLLGILIYRQKLNHKIFFILLSWWVLPLVANMMFAKVFTGRYILFTVPPLIILMSIGLSQFKLSLKYTLVVLTVLCTPGLMFIWNMSTNPFIVKLYSTESGYVSSWTSGWGIQEASTYLISRSHSANVIVGTEGYFGTLPDGLQIYTNQIPQLTVFGVGLDLTSVPEKLIDARNHGDEVYMLFNRSRLKLTPSDSSLLTKVSSYSKPDGDELLLLKLN
ncbi:glycosyltransferase family 39 protein [Candidatus Shapirobacteria bacterium]|nr:glycosyltransferase family 39 protein [Candidatus Shapirobacteria bacterium]